MNLKIVNRAQVREDIWDQFVNDSCEAWFWHTTEFINALQHWHEWFDYSFAVVDESNSNQLMGIFQVSMNLLPKPGFFESSKINIKKMVLILRRSSHISNRRKFGESRLYSIGGYALVNNLTKKQRGKILSAIEEEVLSLLSRLNARSAEIHLPALAPAYFPKVCPLFNPLVMIGCENKSSQTWIIDLDQTQEQIYANFSNTTKQEIKKVASKGYNIREASGLDDYKTYYKLHQETYQRTGAGNGHAPSYFESIFLKIVHTKMCRILFLEKDGEVVAANNSIFYKNVASYWTGASANLKDPGVNKYLLYLQILHAKQIGYHYFDCGEAFPHIREGKLRGLNLFKKSLGGSLHPIHRGVLS